VRFRLPDEETVSSPVLLLHGFTTSSERTWSEPGWVDLISEAGRPVIAPDLLGHGSNVKPHDPAAYQAVEQDVSQHLASAGQVDAIGYSAGARILLSLIMAEPSRFRRIVLAGIGGRALHDPDAAADSDGFGARLPAVLLGDREPDNPVEERFLTMATTNGNDPRALAAFAQRGQPPLTAVDLASVTQPVLVAVGETDFARPAEPLVDALSNSQLHIVKRVDHFGLPKSFDFVERALDFIGAAPSF